MALAFTGAVSLTILTTTPVTAQQANQSAPASSDSGIGQLQEVLVTARRREERLQSVPIAITAYSEEDIKARSIESQSDLAINTPSLVDNASGFPSELGGSQSFAIRGQGPAYGAVPGTVAYFADVPDLSFASIDGRRGTYFDLESVQVLKGPQGTLFGKNATGGNILFEPKKPVDDFDGYAQLQAGDYQDRAFEGALNIPIVRARVLFRIAGSAERRNGYTTDVGPHFAGKDYDNVDYETVRASLVVRPADDIENYTILRYYREDDNGPGTVLIAFNPSAGQGPFLVGSYFPNWALLMAQQQARGPRQVSYNLDEFVTSRNWQAINTTTWDATDWLTIKNIGSFAEDRTRYGYDYDATSDPIAGQITTSGWTNAIDSWTEELQFQGKVLNHALAYTAGLYGDKFYPGENQTFEADYFPVSTVILGGQQLPVLADNQEARSRAAYAQGTYDFSGLAPFLKGLSATAGYLFTHDDVYNYQVILAPPASQGGAGFHNSSYTFDVDYQLSPQTMLYYTHRKGYKAGGVNGPVPSGTFHTFQPEDIIDNEVGIKADFALAGMKFRTDLDAFRGDYSNIQRTAPTVVDGVLLNVTRNVAQAVIQGAEFEGTMIPIKSVEITAAYSHIDSAYTSVNVASAVGILAGAPFPYTPKNKYSISARYHLPLALSLGDLSAEAIYSYQSEQSVAQDNTEPYPYTPSFQLLNLRLDWNGIYGSAVDGALFVTNATNKLYVVGQFAAYNLPFGFVTRTYGPPRMFGVQLRYSFGPGAH